MTPRNIFKRLAPLALAAAFAATTGIAVAQQHDDHMTGPHQAGPANGHFQPEHQQAFQQHYNSDAQKWAHNDKRAHFQAGQAIPRNYSLQAVPSSYYQGAPPPPAGYRYGYYQGYVVSYNPTTRIIADVLDLATGH